MLSLFGTWWGDSLARPRLDISHHCSTCGGKILLLAPGWTSLVVVRHVVGRFSYSPQAGHLSRSFSAWWGDSLTNPRLDISLHHLARSGEILLLAPGWTSIVAIRRVVGRFSYSPQAGHLSSWFGMVGRFSYSPQAGHLASWFGAWWGESLTRPRLDTSRRGSARGGEILLLAPGWTSLVMVRRVVGRFFYSPKAGHLSSFGAWWEHSLTRPRLDISRCGSARSGEILLLAPGWTSLVVAWRVVGRFSYLAQAGHFSLWLGAWWGDSFTRPRMDISCRGSVHCGEILLLAPG